MRRCRWEWPGSGRQLVIRLKRLLVRRRQSIFQVAGTERGLWRTDSCIGLKGLWGDDSDYQN